MRCFEEDSRHIRKRFSLLLYYESGQFKVKWEEVMTLTLAIL